MLDLEGNDEMGQSRLQRLAIVRYGGLSHLALSGASGRLRGIMAFSSDLLAEAIHGTGLLTGDDCC
jgi:hypothetical protein